MGQCLNGPDSHWPHLDQRQLQLQRPDVYFASLALFVEPGTQGMAQLDGMRGSSEVKINGA
jgi:hypothetical protein